MVTESVFSMDGDLAPLAAIVKLTQAQGVSLLVDEAHATGLYGAEGSGRVAAEGLTDQVDWVMGTYSKALGGFGAYVVCSELQKAYLINRARSFIYSTALPPSVVASNLAALEVVRDEPQRRQQLAQRALWFRKELVQRGLTVLGESQIVPWVTGDAARTIRLSRRLEALGYYVLPVRPPTVPQGQARLRFSLSVSHDQEALVGLVAAIEEVAGV